LKFCFLGSIYASYSGQATGGAELQLALICKQLVKSGHQVDVIDLKIQQEITSEEGIRFHPLKRKGLNKFRYLEIYRLCKNLKPDVFYMRVRNARQLIPLIISKITDAKFIYHVAHDMDTVSFKSRVKNYYRKNEYIYNLKKFIHAELALPIILKFANYIFVQHNIQKENLIRKGYQKTHIIYNLFSFPSKPNKVKEKIPKQYYIILGSLDERKGVKNLYQIIHQVKEKNFVIIGQARDKMGKKFIADVKNLKNVAFLNSIKHDEVFSYLEKSDALISASKMEGFSNAFLESWSVGKPVYSLHAEAGGKITENNLGICFYGNLTNMIQILKENLHDFEPNILINYVKETHDPKSNVNKIIETINHTT
jgi:glycosyltransferase involved in cell wall biosynthesis